MTNAATTVGARVLQFQVGSDFLQTTNNSSWGSGQNGAYAEGVIRVGVVERLEVDFLLGYQRLGPQRTNGTTGASQNLGYGFRLRGNMLKANGHIPSIGMLAEVTFPQRGTPMYQNSIIPKFLVLIEEQLEERVKLSSNIGMTWVNSPTLQYTLNLSVSISPKLTMYLEHFGQYYALYGSLYYWGRSDKKTDYWYPRLNGGLSFLATKDLQLDVQAGIGKWLVSPHPEQKDWYVGLGLSYRVRFKKREKKGQTDS
ncbi:MAG: hypothetical protein GC178_15210 [Flavobacteriales bacterium]|nr:hypothetical protein [Flavobacteriales bacterium]